MLRDVSPRNLLCHKSLCQLTKYTSYNGGSSLAHHDQKVLDVFENIYTRDSSSMSDNVRLTDFQPHATRHYKEFQFKFAVKNLYPTNIIAGKRGGQTY